MCGVCDVCLLPISLSSSAVANKDMSIVVVVIGVVVVDEVVSVAVVVDVVDVVVVVER